MPVEENIALMRRWFKEVWNEGRVQTIYDLLDEHISGWGQDVPGVEIRKPADFVALYNRIHGAFPDMKITVEDAFGAEDKIVLRWSATMTHTGDHLGIAATSRKIRITGITIARIVKGKIVEGWDNWDQLALMQQISNAAAATP
jgi:predicted ester cyclase